MKVRKQILEKLTIFFALMLCVVLAGCNQPAPPLSGEPSQKLSGELPKISIISTFFCYLYPEYQAAKGGKGEESLATFSLLEVKYYVGI